MFNSTPVVSHVVLSAFVKSPSCKSPKSKAETGSERLSEWFKVTQLTGVSCKWIWGPRFGFVTPVPTLFLLKLKKVIDWG